jgi:acyl-CoA thioesterase-1
MHKKTNSYTWLFLSLSILFISCTEPNDPPYTPPQNYKEKITVVIIGSSIASGEGASNYANSWAGTLQNNSQDNIINNAKGGYLTYHFLPETIWNNLGIETDVNRNITTSLKLNPDLIIFSITTNDIANGYTVDEYMANMKVMTNLCEVNHVSYLVGSTTPRILDSKKMKALIEINDRLKTEYDNKFVNYYNELTNLDTFTIKSIYDAGDNLHPNNAGHKVIFDAIYPVYLKQKNEILKK